MTHKVFIDGEAGTTGLLILDRLKDRQDISLIQLDNTERKDVSARKRAINESDVSILCLPDDAAIEAVALVENDQTVLIDASTAHRTSEGWVYGLAELSKDQRAWIKASKRISNPGCHATGFVALVRPLVDAGLLPPYFPVTATSLTGYSGGGKSMIAEFETALSQGGTEDVCRLYATGLAHKHLPEMTMMSGLQTPPLFSPTVGRFKQGLMVQVPLHLWALPDEPDLDRVHAVIAEAYAEECFIDVVSRDDSAEMSAVNPEMCTSSNQMKIFVFGNEELGQSGGRA